MKYRSVAELLSLAGNVIEVESPAPGRLALDHLRLSLTRGNLWLYILSELRVAPANPAELKARVRRRHNFSPASITFYSVLYKLRREGLVRKSSDSFRSAYEITGRGTQELERALSLMEETRNGLSGYTQGP